MNKCPCGLQEYSVCCEPFHKGELTPLTPEALMRSRYSAYALAKVDYIEKTMRGKALSDFDKLSAKAWAKSVQWIGLDIIKAKNESVEQGSVEFIAKFIEGNTVRTLHEVSEFHYLGGLWFYTDGKILEQEQNSFKNKIGRNSQCPCGSHKKFKNCHGKSLI